MELKLVTNQKIAHKRVFLRVDYNVPLRKIAHDFKVVDDARIRRSLKTLQFLIENKSTVIIATHLGRPKGHFQANLSTKPLAESLAKIVQRQVVFCPALKFSELKTCIDQAPPGSLIMMENLRFFPGEELNDQKWARQLASLADVYINEAFSTAHRKHASIIGLPQYLPAFAGFGFNEEVNQLSQLISRPKRPFVVIVGGAKISDKVAAVKNLTKIANIVLVGGGVANNFLAADGYNTANSYLQEKKTVNGQKSNYIPFAKNLLRQTKRRRFLKDGYIPLPKIVYPTDVVAAKSLTAHTKKIIQLYSQDEKHQLDDHLMYLDIGPKTIKLFREIILGAGTVFWNGPMGVFENDAFATGTREIAQAIAKSSAYTVVGGGDTLAAVDKFGLSHRFDYISAAGGAALDFLSGKMLPGVKPLVREN